VVAAVSDRARRWDPGRDDIGIIALGALLEERRRRTLDALFAEESARSFGHTGLCFVRLDVDGFHGQQSRVAPTERCACRRRVVHGQVHDENAFAMGGVAGHAGLFGTLLDVERAALFLRTELARPSSTLARFAAVPAGTRRPIGFDKVTPRGSTGDALSSTAVGHLAFTGCSLWIDGDAIYILLSNRIHESREHPERMLALRRAFHQAAMV
jgi:CubicO group peptidase (beta-lactamase class C family)